MLSRRAPVSTLARPSEGRASRLVMASNRGPVEHWFDGEGRIRRRDAAGGVATALTSIARNEPVTWISSAAGEADRAVALLGRRLPVGEESYARLIDLPDGVFEPFYNAFCNPILWFVQHSLADLLGGRDLAAAAEASWRDGYVPANHLFADAIIEELAGDGSGARVMLHDYHFYLAPRLIRIARPRVALQQFIHIPWPEPEAWRALPAALVVQICKGLLANDSVVFQTETSVENFLATCRAFLCKQAQVLEREGMVERAGGRTYVWSNPISVDVAELEAQRALPLLAEYRGALAAAEDVQTIVRVDRLDPSKNVAAGFEAFDLLLDRNPRLRGRVRFLAYLIPSRMEIAEYEDYAARVFALIEAINEKYGSPDWTPITVFHENNRLQAFAGLAEYDVLLVNSLADGMNLVSKEGPVLNERDGVLALSVTAGSYDELRHGAIALDPADIASTAAALATAIAMAPAERRQRAAALREAIAGHQLSDWLRQQLKDLSIATYVKEADRAARFAAAS